MLSKKRRICFLIIITLSINTTLCCYDVQAVPQSLIEDIQNTEQKIQITDSEISKTLTKLSNIQNKISVSETNLSNKQQQIEKLKKDLSDTQKLLNKRIKSLYMNNFVLEWLRILLTSSSLGELSSKLQNFSFIVNHDTKVITAYKEKQNEITLAKKQLEEENKNLILLKDSIVQENTNLTKKKSENQVLLASLNTKYTAEVKKDEEIRRKKALEEFKKKQEEETRKQQEELKKQAEKHNSNKPSNVSNSGNTTTTTNNTNTNTNTSNTNTNTNNSNNNNNNSNNNNNNNNNNNMNNNNSNNSNNNQNSSNGGNSNSGNQITPPSSSGTAYQVLNFATNFIGIDYVWGGSSPSGFDCSGLTSYSFAHFGIILPRVAEAQQSVGRTVSPSEAKPGDLIFFGFPAYHVGFYAGNGLMLHAPYTGAKIRIDSINLNGASIHNIQRIIE